MIKNSNNLASHGIRSLRESCIEILECMLEEIRGDRIIERKLRVEGNRLKIENISFNLNFRRIFVIGFGKASGEMALGLEKVLGDRISGGIINTDHPVNLKKIKVNICSHPLPDDLTVKKSMEIVNFLSHMRKTDLVIVLVSGGASALFEIPAKGVTIKDIRETVGNMLSRGYDIKKINDVRIKLSAVKGGRLLRYIYPAEHITLVLSDVIGNPKYVGSGPTYSEDNRYVVIGDNQEARDTAKKVADNLGFDAKNSTIILHGEPKNMAKDIYQELKESKENVLIWGGETTVDVENSNGIGGRNQELALYLAKFIDGKDICFSCMGTDGIDGPTDVAGGMVDGMTLRRLKNEAISINKILLNHDSYTALKKLGDLIITGPTGTNVADICIGVKI